MAADARKVIYNDGKNLLKKARPKGSLCGALIALIIALVRSLIREEGFFDHLFSVYGS